MKLIYPALTLVSLLLVSLPAMASPMAIAISIDWAKVAIAGGLVLAGIGIACLAIWLSSKVTIENAHIFMISGAVIMAVLAFVAFYLSL